MDVQQFELRKREHIDQALDSRNQAQGMAGLEEIRLRHEAILDDKRHVALRLRIATSLAEP